LIFVSGLFTNVLFLSGFAKQSEHSCKPIFAKNKIKKMKQLICALALVMSFSFAVNTQKAQPKIIALITRASWCVVCQANGPRFMKDIMPMIQENKDVLIVTNDLSDKKTTASSKRTLQKAGLDDFAEKNPATGMLYLFNANTKKLLSSASLADSNEEIEKAYKKALSKI